MYVKLWTIAPIVIGALAISGCQTPVAQNQATQTINVPVVEVILDSDGDGVPDDLDMCPDTQENAVVDDRGCHITVGPEMGLKIEHRAFFAKGSSELLLRYQAELDTIAERMEEHKTATMHIEGNIAENEEDNNRLTAQSNSLAQNRAMIIKNYLIMKHKVAAERIMTYDCGTKIQIAPNDTPEGRHMNRRVYTIVFKPEEQEVNHYPSDKESKICVEV